MWSDERNCDVSDDFPTPEAPSMATLYLLGGGPVAISTAGVILGCCCADGGGGTHVDDRREAREGRRDPGREEHAE